jgi:hypothetical protein
MAASTAGSRGSTKDGSHWPLWALSSHWSTGNRRSGYVSLTTVCPSCVTSTNRLDCTASDTDRIRQAVSGMRIASSSGRRGPSMCTALA